MRINAENPDNNFAPCPGDLTGLTLPSGDGVRVDTGFADGDRISPYYDSIIAKLICAGADRDEAIALARKALEVLSIGGLPFNGLASSAIAGRPDTDGRRCAHRLA